MNKLSKILLFTLFGVSGLIIFYLSNHTYRKIPDGELIYLNPFQINNKSFENNNKIATDKLKIGDTLNSIKYCHKVLNFRGTFNEKKYANTYSDSKNYWDNESDKSIKYSMCFEIIGQVDSAISCLPLLNLPISNKRKLIITERIYQLEKSKKHFLSDK